MADTSPPSRSMRLIRAVEHGRAGSLPRERTAAGRTAGSGKAEKTLQRAVKFSNPSSALRRLVTEARNQAEAVPAVRLRIAPAATERPATTISARPARSFASGAPSLNPPDPEALVSVRTLDQLSDIVRRARRRQGLTQAGLAHAAGTGRRFVSDVEAGKPTVEFERLMKLCRSLGIRLFAIGPDDDQ